MPVVMRALYLTVQKPTVTRMQLGEIEWYRLTEAADFQEVRYRVVKLQGLCLVVDLMGSVVWIVMWIAVSEMFVCAVVRHY